MNISRASEVIRAVIAAALICGATGASAAGKQSVERPDCSAYAGKAHAERRCYHDAMKAVSEGNAGPIQKADLLFAYYVTPDLDSHPDAQKALEANSEGSFTISYDVGADGTVTNVKVARISSEAVQPLAALWIDTIGQWQFAAIKAPAKGLEFRRLYLHSQDDEDDGEGEKGDKGKDKL